MCWQPHNSSSCWCWVLRPNKEGSSRLARWEGFGMKGFHSKKSFWLCTIWFLVLIWSSILSFGSVLANLFKWRHVLFPLKLLLSRWTSRKNLSSGLVATASQLLHHLLVSQLLHLHRIADIAVRSNDSEWERVVRPLTEMDPMWHQNLARNNNLQTHWITQLIHL